MTGGQIDKQSWHDWNKKTVSPSVHFSLELNLIVVSDAAPNPHTVTGASASALPGNSSSTTSTSSPCSSPSSSSHSSSLPSYASHDQSRAAVRRQGNKNISENISLNKICLTPVSRGAGSFSSVPFYSHKTLLKWRCQAWDKLWRYFRGRDCIILPKTKYPRFIKYFCPSDIPVSARGVSSPGRLSLALNIDKTGYELPHRH